LQVNNNAEYYYNDPDSTKLSKSPNTIEEDSSGAIMNTVMQLDGDLGDSYAYALYNDQTPLGSSSDSRAHSKGLMLFDGEKGFWMVHSVPKWPGAVSQGWYDISSLTYAQSIMCTTFRLDRLEDIAALQMVQWPLIYSSGISSDLMDDHPQFVEWITGSKNKTATNTTTELVSYNGRHMTHYSKSNYCDCDLWGDVVAPGVKSNMRVETWQNGNGGKLPDFCAPDYEYSVVNITAIAMPDGNASWRETQDHSKWGVSEEDAQTVCIGDINRQPSQEDRGGGALCYASSSLWKAFDAVVDEVYDCSTDGHDTSGTGREQRRL
jgi:deoxyribonuclease-2